MTDAEDPIAGGAPGNRPEIGWSAVPSPEATQAEHGLARHGAQDSLVPVDDRNRLGTGGQHRAGRRPNADVRAAAFERLSADHVVQKHPLGIASVVHPLIVSGHRLVRVHELAGVRILHDERLEVHRRKRVDHHITRRQRRMHAPRSVGKALNPQHVARAAHIAQRRLPVGFIPERDRSLLNHEDMGLVRFALPQDVVIRLMKLDAPARGELEKIAFLDGVKGWMLFEKVGNTIADRGSVHVAPCAQKSLAEFSV